MIHWNQFVFTSGHAEHCNVKAIVILHSLVVFKDVKGWSAVKGARSIGKAKRTHSMGLTCCKTNLHDKICKENYVTSLLFLVSWLQLTERHIQSKCPHLALMSWRISRGQCSNHNLKFNNNPFYCFFQLKAHEKAM